MVKNILNKSLFGFAVILFFGITDAVISATPSGDAGFTTVENKHDSSIRPGSRPALFGIQQSGVNLLQLLRNHPVPNAKDDPEDSDSPDAIFAKTVPISVPLYLKLSRNIDRSQSKRGLLFPFHFFF